MNRIKSIFQLSLIAFMAFGLVSGLQAQEEDKSQRPSPPMTESASVGEVAVTINYGAPSVKGRTIWGDLVPYGQVWRAGANEATTIEFDKDVLIEGQPLAAGKYAFFTIPGEDKWTVIFNSVAEQWGAYDYDDSEDALRVEVSPMVSDESAEVLTYKIKDMDGKTFIAMMWENLVLPVGVAPAVSN